MHRAKNLSAKIVYIQCICECFFCVIRERIILIQIISDVCFALYECIFFYNDLDPYECYNLLIYVFLISVCLSCVWISQSQI